MRKNYLELAGSPFARLIEEHGFSKENEPSDGQSYSVEYRSATFVVKLEKYWREVFATLYKPDDPGDEINLFALLEYLNPTSPDVPRVNYFKEEKDITERLRKQFDYIAATVYDNLKVINDFFNSENLKSRIDDLRKFMINRSPDVFGRGD